MVDVHNGRMRWGVVVAAGGVADSDLARAIQTHRKALAKIGEKTSLAHTLDAVKSAGFERCVTVSGPEVALAVHHGDFVEEADSAVDNALLGLEALIDVEAVLFIPADTPFLEGDMLTDYTRAVESRAREDRWYSAGLTPTPTFLETYPGVPVESLRLREGRYLSGALYAANPAGLRHAIDVIRGMRRSRKSQLSMAFRLGPLNLIRYFTGRISLGQAERVVGNVFGGQVVLVPDCHPASCLDFDTVEDFEHIIRLALKRP